MSLWSAYLVVVGVETEDDVDTDDDVEALDEVDADDDVEALDDVDTDDDVDTLDDVDTDDDVEALDDVVTELDVETLQRDVNHYFRKQSLFLKHQFHNQHKLHFQRQSLNCFFSNYKC